MRYLISIGILLLIGGMIGGYGVFLLWAFGQASFSLWVTIFVSLVFLGLLIGLFVAFILRWKELSREDRDDYRNY